MNFTKVLTLVFLAVAAEPVLACTALPATVTESGNYCMAGDRDAGFVISASDVTVDMHGRCINGPTDPATQTVGILIGKGVARVTIRGGCLRGFQYGIRTAIDDTSASGIDISDLDISGATFRGIQIFAQDMKITRSLVHNNGGTTAWPDAYAMGIETRNTGPCTIADNIVREVYPTEGGSGEGVAILIENDCTVSGNVTTNSRLPATGRTFALWSGAALKPIVRDNIARGFNYGFETYDSTGNIAIDIACVSYGNLPHGDHYLRTQPQPQCPDDLRLAHYAATIDDKYNLFRVAQAHTRANQMVTALAYFKLASAAGSAEATRMIGVINSILSDDDEQLADRLSASIRKHMLAR